MHNSIIDLRSSRSAVKASGKLAEIGAELLDIRDPRDGRELFGRQVIVRTEVPPIEDAVLWDGILACGGIGAVVGFTGFDGDRGFAPMAVTNTEVEKLLARCRREVGLDGSITYYVLEKELPVVDLEVGVEVVLRGDDGYGNTIDHGRAVVLEYDEDLKKRGLVRIAPLQGAGFALTAKVRQVERVLSGTDDRSKAGERGGGKRPSVGRRKHRRGGRAGKLAKMR